MLPQIIQCSSFQLRPWRIADKPALLRYANDRVVWRNMSGNFPYPFTDADADQLLAVAAGQTPPEGIYAIEADREAVGMLSIVRGRHIECCFAEIGYWLGEAHRGRGIATEAVGRVVEMALAEPNLVRVAAPVAAWNTPSMRVLERNGFVREAVLRRAGYKDGTLFDRVIYARIRESADPYVAALECGPTHDMGESRRGQPPASRSVGSAT
ncbi:MAG: hypothetical protein JWM41_717 [Gemmatimonadetes bacterium]|nr:hypothetical protein [Gemmatimonadota bacterium]